MQQNKSNEILEMTRHEKIKKVKRILARDKDKTIQNFVLYEDELKAEKCRQNFYYFVQQFIGELIPGDIVLNWHIKFLCDILEKYAFRIIARLPALSDLIINIIPGSTKSTICSQLFPAWCWIAVLPDENEYKIAYEKKRNKQELRPDKEGEPEKRIYGAFMRFGGVSFNEKAALANAMKHKTTVESDKYKLYFPEIMIKRDASAVSNFWNAQGGQRWSVGINGGVTGQHFDCQLVDDPMDPKASVSELKTSGANEYIDETLSSRCTDVNVTVMIVIMQRLAALDTTGHLLSKAKKNADIRPIQHICLPITFQEYIQPEICKDFYIAQDGFFDPIRRDKNAIARQRAALGPYGASGQLDQIPIQRGQGLFNADKIVDDVPIPPLYMIDETVRYWDKAGTQGGGDFSCGTLMHRMKKNYDGPMYVVQHMHRGQWGSTKRNKEIKQTAKNDAKKFGLNVINWIEQEPGSGGKESAEITVKELAGFRVKTETKQSSGGKEGRAEPYADQVENENVGFCIGGWNIAAKEEMALAPRGAHDDTWDSGAGAFNKLAIGTLTAGTW